MLPTPNGTRRPAICEDFERGVQYAAIVYRLSLALHGARTTASDNAALYKQITAFDTRAVLSVNFLNNLFALSGQAPSGAMPNGPIVAYVR